MEASSQQQIPEVRQGCGPFEATLREGPGEDEGSENPEEYSHRIGEKDPRRECTRPSQEPSSCAGGLCDVHSEKWDTDKIPASSS